MPTIKDYENKIKLKRAKTDFRDFIMEIASWIPLVLYKTDIGISRYPETDRMKNKVVVKEYYENWDDHINRGHDYDYKEDFFENYYKLFKKVPYLSLVIVDKNINCDYADSVLNSKNVYLSFIVINGCENILYTFYCQDEVKNVLNSVMVWDHSEIVYYSSAIIKSFKVFYSKYIVNSNNIWFSTNLLGCSECILCDNLQNKKYYIKNKEYSKGEYLAKKEEILKEKNIFADYYDSLNSEAKNLASENVSGNFCVYSENVENGYFAYKVKNARNIYFVGDKEGRENIMDTVCSDDPSSKDVYCGCNIGTVINGYICDCVIGQNVYYCYMCVECSYCFGCTGLFNKSYCILNKQYSKEDWKIEVEKIMKQMDEDGILGKFFPANKNPFYFNDTLAYLIEDYSKEEVIKKGFMWRDDEIKVDIPNSDNVIQISDLDEYQGYREGNWFINPEITDKVIIDKGGNYYKIVKMEYDFLLKHSLPLPIKHWSDRIRDGLKK